MIQWTDLLTAMNSFQNIGIDFKLFLRTTPDEDRPVSQNPDFEDILGVSISKKKRFVQKQKQN